MNPAAAAAFCFLAFAALVLLVVGLVVWNVPLIIGAGIAFAAMCIYMVVDYDN